MQWYEPVFQCEGKLYVTVVITIETAISLDSAIQRAMDNYMTTHFSADDFIWSFQAKLGNVWKRLSWTENFSKT